MTTQSERDARRQEREASERERQTAFGPGGKPSWWRRNFGGGDSATTATPDAQAAWDRSMASYVPPGGPNRQRLDDQSREAAYDPAADQFDPRNMRPVDMQGQTLWTNNYDNLPQAPQPTSAKPVTKLSPDLSKAIAATVGDWVQPGGPRGLVAQPSSDYDVPPDMPPQAPPVAVAGYEPREGEGSPLQTYTPQALASLPPYELPSGVTMPYPPGTFGGQPPVVTAGKPSLPIVGAGGARSGGGGGSEPDWAKRYIGWRNRMGDRANQWLERKGQQIGDWSGKVYADGGPVGFAEGGDFTPLSAFGGASKLSPSHAVVGQAAPLSPMSAPRGGGGGDDGLGSLSKLMPLVTGMFGGNSGYTTNEDMLRTDRDIAEWSKAQGGPVGFAQGGQNEGDTNVEGFDPLRMFSPLGMVLGGGGGGGGGGFADFAKTFSPLGMILGGAGVFADGGPVGYAEGGDFLDDGGGSLGWDTDDDQGGFQPLSAFGTPQIGESHAVVGQPAPLPQMAPQGGGGGGGGGGGMGDIMGMAMKLAPMAITAFSDERLKENIKPVGKTRSGMKLIKYNMKGSPQTQVGLSAQDVEKKRPSAVGEVGGYKTVNYEKALRANGGPIGMMRGGYPELYNRPIRKQFSTGGGDHYVKPDGRGNGRSDHIEAALSPGEFVMDAETVSLAGDGDNNAGARQFESLRQNIRKHKGQQLAKGKFSPKAKPVESYMSGKLTAADRAAHAGVSDGIRQQGRRR